MYDGKIHGTHRPIAGYHGGPAATCPTCSSTDPVVVAARRFEVARDQWAQTSERWASAALMGRPDPEGLSVATLEADLRTAKRNTDEQRAAMRAAMADAGVAYQASGEPPIGGAHA